MTNQKPPHDAASARGRTGGSMTGELRGCPRDALLNSNLPLAALGLNRQN
jgi:hypothetical protein